MSEFDDFADDISISSQSDIDMRFDDWDAESVCQSGPTAKEFEDATSDINEPPEEIKPEPKKKPYPPINPAEPELTYEALEFS